MVVPNKKKFIRICFYLQPLIFYGVVYRFLPILSQLIIKNLNLSLFNDSISWLINIFICYLGPIFVGYYIYSKKFFFDRLTIKNLVITFLLGILTIYTFYWTFNNISFSSSSNQKSVNSTLTNPSNFAIQLQILKTVVLAPFLEEIFFRGVLMKTYFKNSKFGFDIVISSLLFGLAHSHNNFFEVIPYIAFGIGLSLIFKITNKLQYSLMIHVVNNAISSWELISIYIL